MKKLLLTSACVIALVPFSGTANADVRDDEMQTMKEQVEFLMQEMVRIKNVEVKNNSLAQEVEALKIQQEQDHKEKEALTAQVNELKAHSMSSITPAAGKGKGGFSLNPGPTFKTADGKAEFAIGGKVHVESTLFDDDIADNPDGTEIRRAQVVVKGRFDEDWFFAFENEFAGNSVTVTDALLGYDGFENTEVKIGHFKEPFSSDFLTSDESNVFIEFSPLNLFTPERSIGVGASTHGDNWSLAAGGFGEGTGTASGVDEGKAVSARLTYAPVNEPGRVVHLGGSGSYRMTDAADNVTLSANPGGANRAAAAAVSTGTIADVDDTTTFGLDVSGIFGPLMVQGRYVRSGLDTAAGDADFDGFYVQASYALTGESMTYNSANGSLRRIKPANDFKLGESSGAWEVGARYDTIDLTDGAITGGEMDNYVLGLNWYPNDRMRFMLNYTFVDTDDSAVVADDDPQILGFRAQYDF